MKKKILMFFVFVISSPLIAQFGPDAPPSGYEDGPDPPPEGPPSAPIDDYIPLLITAGVVVGFLKLNNKTKSITIR